MEYRVIQAFDLQKEILIVDFKKKYNLPDEEIDRIIKTIESVIHKMINLIMTGKSTHEKFFSDIILNSIDAIVGFDNSNSIFLWNRGAVNIFGYTKDEATGKDFSILIPDYLIEKGEREFLINEVKSKGFLANYESETKTRNGKIVNVSSSMFAIFNERKEMMGSVGIIRDITPLKSLEKELREKENLALIGEVVSSIAHSLITETKFTELL